MSVIRLIRETQHQEVRAGRWSLNWPVIEGIALALAPWAVIIAAIIWLSSCATPFYETEEGRVIQARAQELNVMLEDVVARQRAIDAAFDNFVRYNLGWL